MAKLADFENLAAVAEWVHDRRARGIGGREDHELAFDMIEMLRKFGYDEPKSPVMRSIEGEKKYNEFIKTIDAQGFIKSERPYVTPRCVVETGGRRCTLHAAHTMQHAFEDAPVVAGTCGTLLGVLGLRCNLPQRHEGTHKHSRERAMERAQVQRAHTHAVRPLLQDADPELERLLREEEEIIKATRGPCGQILLGGRLCALFQGHGGPHESDTRQNAPIPPICNVYIYGGTRCRLLAGHHGVHEDAGGFTGGTGMVTAPPVNVAQIPPMVPGAPPLAPALHGKTILPDMGPPQLPAIGNPPHGTAARYDLGCLCAACADAHYAADEYEDEDYDGYEPEPEEFDE